MYIKENELQKFIEQSGLVSAEDLKTALNESKKTGEVFENILVRQGKIKDDELRRMEAYVLGIPFVSLVGQKIDSAVLSLIPEPLAAKNNIVAYRRSERGLEVAMLDIDDLSVLDFIKKKVGIKILPRLTDIASMKDALNQYKKSLKADFDALIQKESQSLKAIKEEDGNASEKDLKEMAEDLPVIKIVDTLISHAIIQNTSDIHIEPLESSLVVRYRIDGILHDAMVLPKETAAGIVARIKVLSNLKLDEKRLPQDGRFRITTETGDKVSFRISTLPIYYGEKVVIRLLKENSKGFTLEGLGFHGEGLEKIHNALRQTTGMILATGPTGSGKTTTLYTVLDLLNTTDVNISTIEDPIEYQMPRINQTQVKSEIGLTFANGLRTLLRQDPDIIMVGEIRDGETVSLAINASLTGHLVLSTIHTNSAAGAIPRMIDMGAESFLIVSTVKTIIAQRLVRRLCNTKEKYNMNDAELKALGKIVDLDRMLNFLKAEKLIKPNDDWKDVTLYRPKPGGECEDGFKGRVGIHEVLEVSPAVKELILKGASADDIEAQAKSEGMMTMLEDGIYQAVLGMTSIDEVLRVITE